MIVILAVASFLAYKVYQQMGLPPKGGPRMPNPGHPGVRSNAQLRDLRGRSASINPLAHI